MKCPRCGAFIGIYACDSCSGIIIKTSDGTGEIDETR